MSLFVARNDGEHYGELILYQMPKSKTRIRTYAGGSADRPEP